MSTLNMPTTLPEIGVRASKAAPVIVATDGRTQSDGALVLGGILAEAAESIRVVTVLKTMPIIPDAPLPVSTDLEAARRAEVLRDVKAQIARTWDASPDVEIETGDPATIIAKIAHEAGATMIVSGLGRHRVSDRVFGDETALRLIRLADVPVFAAGAGLNHAPRRIVIAIDFSETSLRAARLAIELAAPGATIYLAHVAPRDGTSHDWKGWGTAYKNDAGAALQKVREQLRVPSDMTTQKILLQGDAATELLAFASSVNADLIASGSHGYGFVARMLIGSVTTRIVRCATCSVLSVPHAAAMTRARITAAPPVATPVPASDWSKALDEFTRRNSGRRGTLEVDDPEIGAQAQEFDYPLLGATFDSHDQRVELMFGDDGAARRHLSRGIGNVKSIDILRDDAGHDLAIRIAHGSGQTLLTFAA
ncbi:MAG: universal stress protein [Gemmatimonadaceae bacterium]